MVIYNQKQETNKNGENDMKYNRSKIMKRAWELVKKAHMTISNALKTAWKEVKNTVFEIKKGKSYTVKDWFANKVANEVKRNITMCDLYGILKETDKAVYALVTLGCEHCKMMWIPKSVLIENEVGKNEFGMMNFETYFYNDYKEMVRDFYIDWKID